MIALTWDHRRSTNLGDHAVTEGALALLDATVKQRLVKEFIYPQEFGEPIVKGYTVVYGGGEHLHSRPDLEAWLSPLIDAPRAVVLPSTFGPFDQADHELVRRALGRHPVAARDPVSAELLGAILRRAVPVLADPAMFVPLPTPRAGRFRVLSPRREDKGMRIDERTDRRARDTVAFRTYERRLRAWPGLLVAHSQHDVWLCRALSDAAEVPWVRPTSLGDLLTIYASCRSVYTSRFHGALFARMLGKRLTVRPWNGHGHKWSGVPTAEEVPELKERTLAWVREALA